MKAILIERDGITELQEILNNYNIPYEVYEQQFFRTKLLVIEVSDLTEVQKNIIEDEVNYIEQDVEYIVVKGIN